MHSKILLALLIICSFTLLCCGDKTPPETGNTVKTGTLSDSEYLIISKGYPKKGLTNPVQKQASAKEAAVLSAQAEARRLFTSELDIVRFGESRMFIPEDDGVKVLYYIVTPGVSGYLKDQTKL